MVLNIWDIISSQTIMVSMIGIDDQKTREEDRLMVLQMNLFGWEDYSSESYLDEFTCLLDVL